MEIRPPAAAGTRYPADHQELRTTLRDLLDEADPQGPAPKALILPHASYADAGDVLAAAYARLAQDRHVIRRIVLLGPSHFVRVSGVATSSAEAFETPLGEVEIDRSAVDRLSALPNVETQDLAHAFEHSLEVQLPFLQETLEDIVIVPLAVGEIAPEVAGWLLTSLWGGEETRIIVSSDLSHAPDVDVATALDETAARAIESLGRPGLMEGMACGREAINGLLWLARTRRMHAERIALGHANQAAGTVGYGVFAFTDA